MGEWVFTFTLRVRLKKAKKPNGYGHFPLNLQFSLSQPTRTETPMKTCH